MTEYKKLDGNKIRIPIARAMKLIVAEFNKKPVVSLPTAKADAVMEKPKLPAHHAPSKQPKVIKAEALPDKPPREKPKTDSTPPVPKAKEYQEETH